MYIRNLVFLFACFSVCFCSCRKDKALQKDEILNVRLAKEPASINPILYPNLLGREIYTHLYLPLADINEQDLSLIPILVEEIGAINTQKDGSYTLPIKLRSDANWSDGKPITAADIAFTLKLIKHRLTSADQYRALLEPISDIKIDPSNPKICTVTSSTYLMNLRESILNMEILPKHIFDEESVTDQYNLVQIGDEKLEKDSSYIKLGTLLNDDKWHRIGKVTSGPYTLTSWEDNAQIMLDKVPSYWGEKLSQDMTKSMPSKIQFTIIPDEIGALSELANGNIDLINGLSGDAYKTFSDTSKTKANFSVAKQKSPRYYFIFVNHKSPVLSDIDVRKALKCLIDVKALAQNFENGDAEQLNSFVPSFMPGYNKNLSIAACQTATNILDTDGWKDSNANGTRDKIINGKLQELNIRYISSGDLSKKIGLVLQANAKSAGINLEIIEKDFAVARQENLATGDYDLMPGLGSTDILLENPYDWYHSDNIGQSNKLNYKNTVADSLINVVRSTTDDKQRLSSFHQLQQVLADDVVMIFLYSPYQRIATRDTWTPVYTLKRPGYKANLFTSK
jgi:peptide/nickel transport system substrate-binding protein